jgi:hypothetical protein
LRRNLLTQQKKTSLFSTIVDNLLRTSLKNMLHH